MNKKIIVLGGGPGGYCTAIRAAQLGGEVTLIEKHRLGGTCLNYGCIPSKFLKKSSDTIETIKKASLFGISLESAPVFDMAAHVLLQQKVISSQAKGIASLLQKNNITHLSGFGKITGMNELLFTDNENQQTPLQWDKLIIATGSSPLSIPVFPFNHTSILSSTDILALQEVPESLVIVGGGVIGCEFGSIFSTLGTKVTIIEAMDRLLPIPSIDPEVSKTLLREMKKKKITIHTSKTVISATNNNSMLDITVRSASHDNGATTEDKVVQAEKMLVSIGRTANSTNIGLEHIGVNCDDRGWIKADEYMQTNVPGVFAIGDILGPEKVMLAHVASTEGEIAAENCFNGKKVMHYNVIPNAIFTSPEIGTVGLSEEEAQEQYAETDCNSVLYRSLGKAHASHEIAGSIKLISEKHSGRILGAHIIGARATDLVAEATLAIKMKYTIHNIIDTIHAHPTFSEILLEVALKAANKPLHG